MTVTFTFNRTLINHFACFSSNFSLTQLKHRQSHLNINNLLLSRYEKYFFQEISSHFLLFSIFYCYNGKKEEFMNSIEIAAIVRHCRKQSGLSQHALAKLAGVGKTVVFNIEKGKETVQLNTLLSILDVLNIQVKFETPFTQTMENNK
jgi:HTH-type transcriptional regulator/antitoxin HipB